MKKCNVEVKGGFIYCNEHEVVGHVLYTVDLSTKCPNYYRVEFILYWDLGRSKI